MGENLISLLIGYGFGCFLTAEIVDRKVAGKGLQKLVIQEIRGWQTSWPLLALFPYGYPAEERVQQQRFDETRIHYVE